jgi:signal transduction histidine kinase
VASLFEDSTGRLWVSSPRGLACFEAGAARAVSVFPTGYVHAIAEDRAGDVWVSDQERGLLQVGRDLRVRRFSWELFGNSPARTLAADPDEGLWLGFVDGGVAYFVNGRVDARYTVADGLGRGQVSHLRFAADGALWAATDGGLSRVQRGSAIITLRTANGLPCNAIRWTIEDETGAIWLHATCSLIRVLRTELDAWVANPRRKLPLNEYDSSDGVPTHPRVSSYSPTVTKGTDGRLWFASYEGAAVVDPRRLPFNLVVPQVHVEQITADGTSYDPATVGRLPPLVRDLRIEYTASSLSAPAKVRFRYRLDGRDRDWIDAGNRREAFYTDLPPGEYRFRVIAANNDGVWNREGAVWSVVVEPTFYQTAAFKVTIILIVLVGGWSWYRVRMARLAAQLSVRFEERLGERTRIAQELHDTVLQSVLSTSMQLHVVSRQVGDPHLRAKLEHVLDRLQQVNGEGRQTLEGLRTLHGGDEDLGLALARDAEDFRGEQPIEIRLVVEGKRQPLHPLIGDDVYRIGREALANAFRHAAARRVEIQLEYTADRLRVCVRDDGVGIEARVLAAGRPGHWGMLGMRERAERIGATLRVMSAAGAGTEVELLVPGRIGFQRLTPRRRSRWLRKTIPA